MGREQRVIDLIDNAFNVNERSQRDQSMSMKPMSLSMRKQYGVRETKLDEKSVDERATCLVSIFGSPRSKPLYCDAVRYLERSYLDEQVNYAMRKGKNPAALFGAIIYRRLCQAGVYPKSKKIG